MSEPHERSGHEIVMEMFELLQSRDIAVSTSEDTVRLVCESAEDAQLVFEWVSRAIECLIEFRDDYRSAASKLYKQFQEQRPDKEPGT